MSRGSIGDESFNKLSENSFLHWVSLTKTSSIHYGPMMHCGECLSMIMRANTKVSDCLNKWLNS